ncbi:MAG TPA: type II secretion system protein [Candidatus Binatia bacterium]|jgi:prepilin-type N-terminal cleavage/methylation domain-containing protein
MIRFRSSRGFTLLEVLVAMTIVGLGVVTLLQIFSQGLRLQARSTANTEAVAHGARLMDELLARKKMSEGSDSGTLGADGRWTAQIQTMRDAPSSLGLAGNWELKEVALQMVVTDGGRERHVELKTLRLARKANP